MLNRLTYLVKNLKNLVYGEIKDSNAEFGQVITEVEQIISTNTSLLEDAKKRRVELTVQLQNLISEKNNLHEAAKAYLKTGNRFESNQALEHERILGVKIRQQQVLINEVENSIQSQSKYLHTITLKLEKLKSKRLLLENGNTGLKNLKEVSQQMDNLLESEELYKLELALEAHEIEHEESEIETVLSDLSSCKASDLEKELKKEEEAQLKLEHTNRKKIVEQYLGREEDKSNEKQEEKIKKLEELKTQTKANNNALEQFKNNQPSKEHRNEELLESFKKDDAIHQQQLKEFFKK